MLLDLPKTLANRLGIISVLGSVEDWWFDSTRSVKTVGNVRAFKPLNIVGEIRDSLTYIPVRAANARTALRDLPIHNHSNYTFIDMGSGKGRALFLAAELPFRKVQGVEFAVDLHEQACANIRRYRFRKQQCVDIESINANAADFEFPNQNLVICLVNPFGPEVLARMLANLIASIGRHPRHVVVLMLWPEFADLVAQTPGMHVYKQTRRHHIYQNTPQPI
jgi:SAM-dependent methyltransferase